MKALVVGYGSIGSRHARLLTALGCEVAVVSSRDIDFPARYRTLADALSWQPEYVVLANKTSEHYNTLTELAERGFTGTVLVEKPLFHKEEKLPRLEFKRAFVGYNLRFHPVLQKLRTLLQNEKLISVQAYVGQYLPTWRPGSDYRSSYSADITAGGGVLRDLSHELDYLNWLLGGWEQLAARGGHYSSLEINSDDAWMIMMTTAKCPLVSLQMNYLDRLTRRRVLINTDDHTIEADLIQGSIMIDGNLEEMAIERDLTYREQHRAVLDGRMDTLCTLQEGIEVMDMIHAIERSARQKEWVSR
jgi:predicted dehydrogenase